MFSFPDIDQPTLYPSTSSPVLGSNVTLACTVSANPTSDFYKFYKGNLEISSGKTNTSTFIVSKDDQASFKCEASNEVDNKKSESESLDVRCE